MKYQKPKLVVYGEMDAVEWALPSMERSSQRPPVVACNRSTPTGCMCTMGQSKAFAPTACHCANGGARVSYKAKESSLQVVAAA